MISHSWLLVKSWAWVDRWGILNFLPDAGLDAGPGAGDVFLSDFRLFDLHSGLQEFVGSAGQGCVFVA